MGKKSRQRRRVRSNISRGGGEDEAMPTLAIAAKPTVGWTHVKVVC